MSDTSSSAPTSTTTVDRWRVGPGLVVAAAVVGLALRIFVLATPLGRPDADEVLSGLMARHIGDEGFPVFVWGQHYGGTIELLPVWVSTKLFGLNTIAMRLPTFALAAVNALLLWRVTRRYLPEPQARVAGMVFWLGPGVAVWFSVREQLFYPPTVCFGLLLALVSLRIVAAGVEARAREWLALGIVAGVAWWTSSQIMYFVVPAAVVLVRGFDVRAHTRAFGRGLGLAAIAAVIGALPWIVDNVRHDFAALRAGGSFPVIGTYPGRFAFFFTDGLSGELAFRETFTYRWVGGPLGMVLYLAVLVPLGFAAWRAVRAIEWDGVGIVAFPFLFALLPMVMDDPNMRYVFFVVPFVAVLAARLVTSPRTLAAVLAVTLLMSAVGLQRIYTVSEVERIVRVGNVGELDEAIVVLDRDGVDAVWADYWVAYRLDFETDERIIAAPSWGIDRRAAYTDIVRRSPRSAWVVSAGAQAEALERALRDLGVPYVATPAGELVVVVPERPVAPEQLPEQARRA